MNLLDLFEAQQHPAYANLEALQQAVKKSQDATVDFGGGPTTVEYPLARYILSRYQAQQTGADRGQFLAALADARRFDAIAREYRQLADKARLEEQYTGTPRAIGTAFLSLILKHQKDPMPVLIDFEDGQQAFRLTTPEVKDWFARAFESYRRRGKEAQFLETMGTRIGFQKLVSRFIMDKAKLERERLGITPQKKRAEVAEADTENVRTQRIIDKLRIQQPQAKSDMEALVYSFLDAQQKDQAAIDKLEKEIDSTEKSVKSDLQKSLDRLKGRGTKAREKLGSISAADERQDALLKKIVALDKEQSQAIDDLEREVGKMTTTVQAVSTSTSRPGAADSAAEEPASKLDPVQFGAMARSLSEPIAMKARKQSMAPAAVKARAQRAAAKKQPPQPVARPTADITSTGVTDIQAARDKRDAERAAKAQTDLFKQQQSQKQQVANLEESNVDDVEARFNAAMSGKAWNPSASTVEPTIPSTAPMAQTGTKPWPTGPDEQKFDQYLNSDKFKNSRAGTLNPDRLRDVFRNAPDNKKAELLRQIKEGLRQGEYHEAEVTFDDGSRVTVKLPSDEGYTDMIRSHFAKQGKTVKDIKVDWSVRSVNEAEKKPKPTNPQLWGRAKSAARSKFDVYPSAYANAWAAKWYKQHGGGWR